MPSIQIKRGTRAQLNAAASANQLKAGEMYLVTDELVLAIGTAIGAYVNVSPEPVGVKIDQSGGIGDTYGAVTGLINGSNTIFTVSTGSYITGSLLVYLNGQLQVQGTTESWVELLPSAGTFEFNFAPSTGDEIVVVYSETATAIATASDKNVEVVVKEADQLAGTLDSTKVYFIDGIIDMGATAITVPAGGLTIKGSGFDTSKLITSTASQVLFTSPIGGSGNLLLADISIEVTGIASSVYALISDTGNEAIEVVRVNYNNCTSLGYIDNYRQLLEEGTGRFGGSPILEFRGVWNGARFSTCIARNMTIPTALFKAGTGLAFSGRFITDINCDLPVTGALLDFSPSNFSNNETLKISNAFITRAGVSDAGDSTITPNITSSSVKSFWQNNVGIKNTHKYIQARISTEVATTIAAPSNYYPLTGTYTVLDSSHFSMPLNGIFELLSGNGRYAVNLNFQLEGTANDVFSIQAEKSTDGGSSYAPVDHKIAKIQNLVGGTDIGVLGSTFNLDLTAGDLIRLQIENYTGARDLTAIIDSSITIIQL